MNSNVREIGELKPSRSYVSISLTNLAPHIIKAILNGEEPNGLSLDKLVSGFPDDWDAQRKFFKIESR